MRTFGWVVMPAALLGCVVLMSVAPRPLMAKPPEKKAAIEPRDAAEDTSAIRAGSEAFVTAFNQKNAPAIAALWTADGENMDESGRTYAGRNAIEEGYANFFANNPNAQMRIVIASVRLLSDGAAIEEGRAFVTPPPTGSPGVSKYTAVHVKDDGKWRMAAVRDTWSESPSNYANVADLEWLIGEWTAEEHGNKMESVCRWIANKSFVERSYTVTRADGTTNSGRQIIGWNPQAGHVQSWNFSSDGGHAIGEWSPTENGWEAEVQGTTGDGMPTAAVNVLRRLDDNAYVWQSVNRTLGDTALPDTDEVILKRSPAAR